MTISKSEFGTVVERKKIRGWLLRRQQPVDHGQAMKLSLLGWVGLRDLALLFNVFDQCLVDLVFDETNFVKPYHGI